MWISRPIPSFDLLKGNIFLAKSFWRTAGEFSENPVMSLRMKWVGSFCLKSYVLKLGMGGVLKKKYV